MERITVLMWLVWPGGRELALSGMPDAQSFIWLRVNFYYKPLDIRKKQLMIMIGSTILWMSSFGKLLSAVWTLFYLCNLT